MLRVEGDIGGLIQGAQQTGSLKALTAKLQYLHGWGYDAQHTTRVRMVVDERSKEGSLYFLDAEGKAFMYGGLVYHESDNSWGVHT